jgi:hypothetical protein
MELDPEPETRSPEHAGPREGEVRRATARRLGVAGLFLALCVTPVVGRVAMEGRAELDRAREAESLGDEDAQIIHLGRAARWRLPGIGVQGAAIDELLVLAGTYEAAADEQTPKALACLREVRRSLLSTRHVRVPAPETLEEVNGRIATLMARQEYQLGMSTGTEEESRRWHLARLRALPAPSRPWVAVVASWSFVGWVLSCVGFLIWGIDARGNLRGKQAVRWGAAFLVSLVAWMASTGFAR